MCFGKFLGTYLHSTTSGILIFLLAQVRIMKLYQHALRLCSSGCVQTELTAKPLLESIVGSFLLKSCNLPNHLTSIKFAACRLLGSACVRSGQKSRAIKLLIKAISLDESDLSVWSRLFRVATECGRFGIAGVALEHILCERPAHPIALPLALPFYLALSEFELCMDLSLRSLKLDPLDERAIYCIHYIIKFQPNLRSALDDILMYRPNLLTEPISLETREQIEKEVTKLRTAYRFQLDSDADRRKVKRVNFPEPISSLTWSDLLESTVRMYDHLESNSTLCCVLNLVSLLPTELHPQNSKSPASGELSVSADANSPGDNEPISTSPLSLKPVCAAAVNPPDGCPELVVDGLSKCVELPAVDGVQLVVSNELNSSGLAEAEGFADVTEKRRSSRARVNMDLTDGLNRYRAKRGWVLDSDSRVTSTQGVRPFRSDALGRFRLADQLSSLLPQVYRELAETVYGDVVAAYPIEPPVVPQPLDLEDTGSRRDLICLNDPAPISSPDPWSSEVVRKFILLLHETQPNIVTFGIALLLQISQLISSRWSSQLATNFVYLSDRLRDSFPRSFLFPTKQSDTQPLSAECSETMCELLPPEVLRLKRTPSLEVLTRLHVIYVELRLEQLEQVLCPNVPVDIESPPRDPRCSTDENFLSHATVFTLLDTFSLHSPNAPEYIQIQAHFLWINYLLSALVKDYSEMRSYASLLEELLSEHQLTVERNYSVFHGTLTAGHVRILLGHLSGVTEFERLNRLSAENQHSQVVLEMISYLKRYSRTHLPFPASHTVATASTTSGHVQFLDRLALMRRALRHMVDELDMLSDTELTALSIPQPPSSWHLVYQACGFLLQQATRLCAQHDCSDLINSGQNAVNESRKVAYSIASEALELLITDGQSLSAVGQMPLRTELLEEINGDSDCESDNNRHQPPVCGPSVGEACHIVIAVLEFLEWHLKRNSDQPVTNGIPFKLVSFLFEHLVCIEQSIPSSVLPELLRVMSRNRGTAEQELSFSVRLSLVSGAVAAPPHLAWLHVVHELWSLPNKSDLSHTQGCRDRPEVIALLRQIIRRVTMLLDNLAAQWRSGIHELVSADHSDQNFDDRISFNSASGTPSEDLFIESATNDDETIACVNELRTNVTTFWPNGVVSLNRVLAQAVQCLVPSSLFREPDSLSFVQILNANTRRKELSPVQSDTMDDDNMFLLTQMRPSEINILYHSPLWVIELLNLLSSGQLSNHFKLPSNACSPAWWVAGHAVNTEMTAHITLIDWDCAKIIFPLCCPAILPEYDSVKTLSISSELLNLLIETTKLLPSDEEQRLLSAHQVELMMQTKPKGTLGLPSEPSGLSRAVEFYLKDLRACPRRSDSWAALGLIYYSELEQIINLTNLRTERVSPDAVSRCLRCFTVALNLLSNPITLLVERGCLAYQLHSYSARLVKKLDDAKTILSMLFFFLVIALQSNGRTLPEAHLNLCRKWRYRMLQLAESSYEEVLAVSQCPSPVAQVGCQSTLCATSVGNDRATQSLRPVTKEADAIKRKEQAIEESWLCYYMLAKCAEKKTTLSAQQDPFSRGIGQYFLQVMHAYELALEALDSAGAKYPKKIIVYHKLPFRAVEAIEVFYKIHALALKLLLHHGPPSSSPEQPDRTGDQIPLTELFAFLTKLQSCKFVSSAGKPKRGKKRTAVMAGISSKAGSTLPHKHSCETHSLPPSIEASTEQPVQVAEPDAAVYVSTNTTTAGDGLLEELPGLPSQDEFIDLTSPEPATCKEDSPSSEDNFEANQNSPPVIWRKCVDLCRVALELVLQRLPLHYKAMYRLADLYCRAPHLKDCTKALSILLGPLDERGKPTVGGLFKDRKQNNFFHGVWRIPTSDIDRSGNFASHMYRSVNMTLDLLHEVGDWRHLVHIFHQLRKQPPEDKRGFLGESDRVFLAKRSFNLIRPTLMNWLATLSQSISTNMFSTLSTNDMPHEPSVSGTSSASFISCETLVQIYRLHCVSYSRNSVVGDTAGGSSTSKESSAVGSKASTVAALDVSGYADVLRLAYQLCPAAWDSRGGGIEL
ncbi:calcineurin-binding protein cabin-1, partial [Paragonimus westermani]